MNGETEPLLKWPCRETLWHAAMTNLWQAYRPSPPGADAAPDWADEGGNAPITPEEAHRLAPALDAAIGGAIARYETPEHLFELLLEAVNAEARRLIERIPEEQRGWLVEAMRDAAPVTEKA